MSGSEISEVILKQAFPLDNGILLTNHSACFKMTLEIDKQKWRMMDRSRSINLTSFWDNIMHSGCGIKIYIIVGIGSGSDTTQRCSDPTRLWLVGSEHLLVVSDPDPIPYNGVKYRIPAQIVSQIGTAPILGTDLCPKDWYLSLFHTFQPGDHNLNLNHWKNLHSTTIHVGLQVRIRVR